MSVVSYDTMEFAAKLRILLRDQRYSQDMLAQRLKVSQNLVSLWARGKSLPDLKQGKALADLFGVSVDYLADDLQDDPTPVAALSPRELAVLEVARAIGIDDAIRKLVAPPPDIHPVPVRPEEYRHEIGLLKGETG